MKSEGMGLSFKIIQMSHSHTLRVVCRKDSRNFHANSMRFRVPRDGSSGCHQDASGAAGCRPFPNFIF
ncbi:hypothetical protein L3Y34_018864 [Caenorhabditis briggsae]|uniref:Uncharacterized protein n=1 Tax=Caenorhabditis briggsae TaxID=6238 RepID=A0AAE9DND3_CAEBR|nr:hypothetical protein L3Y34_018864 [Caenorhabditis briggsae]